jgi:hypothetical protein
MSVERKRDKPDGPEKKMTDIKQQDLTLRRSLFRFNNLSFVITRAGLNKRNSINQTNQIN